MSSIKVLRELFFLLKDSEIGLGAAIRDASGRVVAAVSKYVAGFITAELGDMLALREGLLLAKSFNLIISVAEVDANNVASMLNSDVASLSDVFLLINDIKALCKVGGEVGKWFGLSYCRFRIFLY
ncbi:hypothetical protein QYF36_023464 [Acer negundo]|nr:hypothetical protein QYF36_023464 [Acer negundo]